MELFKITCVTCRARLSVRDAALIGQILACPRCGMMVQVALPGSGGPKLPAEPAAMSSAASPALNSSLSEMEILSPQAAAADTAVSKEVPAAAQADFDHASEFASAPESPPAPGAPAPLATPAAASWAAYKFGALIVAGAIVGSGIVAAALTWSGVNDQTLASATPSAQSASVPTPPAATPTSDDPHPVSDLPSNALDGLVASATSEAPEQAPPSTALFPQGDEVADPTAPAAPSDEPTNTTTAPSNAESPAEDATPVDDDIADAADASPVQESSAPRLRIDPLEVDPEGLNLSTLYTDPPGDPLAASQLSKEAPAAVSVPPEPRPDAAEAARLAAAQPVRRDARPDTAVPTDAAVILARRLPAVKFDQMPLCRLLDFAGQLSGLPVSVAPEQLRMAGVSAATPASADVKNATVEELLKTALKPLRLEPTFVDGQLVLDRIGEDKRRSVAYAIDDLADNDAEAQQIAAWIGQLVLPEEDLVKIEGRSLRIDEVESIQYEVLILLERCRLARGLPTRSKYPKSLLSRESHYASMAQRMTARTTFTFVDYTPLREIFRYWQEELQIAVLVDWPALAQERLRPQTAIACSAVDKPWSEAIDSVLTPLGLAWRAVDRRTIEITSADKADAEPQLDVYRLAANAKIDTDELTAKLAEWTAAAKDDEANSSSAIYDADHRILLVRQPAAVQRAVAHRLSEQRLLAE